MGDMQCPFRFNAIYLEKTHREPATEPMHIGGEVAEFLKDYRQHCYETGAEQDTTYFWGLFDKWKNTKRWTNVDTACQCLKNFLKSEFCFTPVRGKESWCWIEQKLTFDNRLTPIRGDRAWFDPGAAFRAIGDFVYRSGNMLTIVDEKTGWARPDPQQLEILAALIPRSVPAMDMKGIFHIEAAFNVLSGFKPETIRIPVMPVHEASTGLKAISAAMEEVNTWPEKYKDTGYPAQTCKQCANCTIPTCPIRKDVMESLSVIPNAPVFQVPASLETSEEAQKAVTFVTFIGQLEKQLKDLLKVYVERTGRPVVSGGMEAGYSEVESFEIEDMAAFIDLLVAWKVSPKFITDALGMSKTDFLKLVKRGGLEPRLPVILDQYVKTKVSRRFGIGKAKTKAANKQQDAA